MARSNHRGQGQREETPAQRRRRRREWRRAFRIMTLAAGAFSILLGVGVAPEVMYRDGDPISALLIALSPLLIVGAIRGVYALVNYSQR